MADRTSVREALERYREAARRSASTDEAEASRSAYEAHTYFKVLRETDEGRAGIIALVDDPDPQVRRWAATHSLMWNREAAREALRSMDDGINA
jgi:hypothetical protein